MWTTGGAGSVDLVLNTKDGITTDDRIDAPAPGHWHQNWAFDMPGTYLIHYNVEGKLVESGEVVRSVSEPIRYAVNVFDRGEIDLEIAYEDGEWEWGLLEEERNPCIYLERPLFIEPSILANSSGRSQFKLFGAARTECLYMPPR